MGCGARKRIIALIQKALRRGGCELVPYPPRDWTRAKNTLQSILAKRSINCVLDVGANEGQYGKQLRGIGYNGRIVSFEPVRSTFDVLAGTAAESGDSWRALPYALGAVETRAEINVAEQSVFTSFLPARQDSLERFPENRLYQTEVVQVKRLDDVLCECTDGIESPRIYLKLDTQGYDLEVIRGAVESLPKILALQTEVSFKPIYENMSGYAETISTLISHGFDVVDFMPVTRDHEGLSVIEMDCVMVRSGTGS
jgi:FkbM family methyltransferase